MLSRFLRRLLRPLADELLLAELGREVLLHRTVRDSWQNAVADLHRLRAENEALRRALAERGTR